MLIVPIQLVEKLGHRRYTDLHRQIDDEDQLKKKLYDKRYNFKFA
jgi:hypothetical protein